MSRPSLVIPRGLEKALWEGLPIKSNVILISSDPKTGKIISRQYYHNIIVTSGKVLVAKMLTEDAIEGGENIGITYGEIGTGTNTPAITDVALQTPTKRNALSAYLRNSNIVQFRTFYAVADCSVFVKEIGLFGGVAATSTIGTGSLFNRAAVSFDNSGGTKDLTVVVQTTFG